MNPSCFTGPNATLSNVARLNCLPSTVDAIVFGFLLFAGTVALFLIVWASVQLILSGGDAKKVGAARQIITYAIIGLIVVLTSFAMVNFVGYVTKSGNCINNLNSLLTGCK